MCNSSIAAKLKYPVFDSQYFHVYNVVHFQGIEYLIMAYVSQVLLSYV